jgi:hypothetical protein
MTRLRRRPRAVAAWLVAVSLLAPGSLGARTGCGVCPTDCPMHRVVAEPEGHDMPCHRAAESSDAPDAGPAVRAACGFSESGDLVVQVRHRSPAAPAWVDPRPAPPVCRRLRAPAAPATEVPTRPPKGRPFALNGRP